MFLLPFLLLAAPAAAPAPAAPSAPAADDWRPSDAAQSAVIANTGAYFAAKDAGRYAEAYAILSDRVRRARSRQDWQREAEAFRAQAGKLRGHRVTGLTWYMDPADAPEPGLYVAADFSAEYERLDFVCGYIMWRVAPDGSLRVAREEQNVARPEPGRKIASIDRQPLRARMGCRD